MLDGKNQIKTGILQNIPARIQEMPFQGNKVTGFQGNNVTGFRVLTYPEKFLDPPLDGNIKNFVCIYPLRIVGKTFFAAGVWFQILSTLVEV